MLFYQHVGKFDDNFAPTVQQLYLVFDFLSILIELINTD